jgi:inorganic pyrophosphatase
VPATGPFPDRLEVLVELARWGFVKRDEAGRLDLISPLPCPFNYGGVPGTRAADGEREDALILGPRLAAGSRVRLPVLGRVRFVDAGQDDAKWVCGRHPLQWRERLTIELFFRIYAQLKRVLNAVSGLGGPTHYTGFEPHPSPRRD